MGDKYTDAQKKASIKYLKEKTDSIQIRTPKGTKERWKFAAANRGKSLNQFIVDSVEADISSPHSTTERPQEGGGVQLSPDALQTAQKAAAATGETVPQFIERAVITQEKRDSVVLKMGGKPT